MKKQKQQRLTTMRGNLVAGKTSSNRSMSSMLKHAPLSFAFRGNKGSNGSTRSLTSNGSISMSEKAPTRRRSVFFGRAYFYEDPGQFSIEERSSSDQQYSREELFEMKQEILFSKDLRDRDMIPPGYDWRGIEVIRDESLEALIKKRQKRIHEVLELQSDLRDLNSSKHDGIAIVSAQERPLSECARANSKQSRKEAVKRGKQDEAAAKKVYEVRRLVWDSEMEAAFNRNASFVGSLLQGSHNGIHLASARQGAKGVSHSDKLHQALLRAKRYESQEAAIEKKVRPSNSVSLSA